MAETSIAKARRLATEKREKREAEEAAATAAAAEAEKEPEEKESSGFSIIESIRKAFSTEDDIKRIDDAVDAVSQGVKKADKDSKRKRNV